VYRDRRTMSLWNTFSDGREVCRIMRHNGVKSPIIMLTGADTDADVILGLDAGANDYVTKPFRIDVLMARLRSHIREHDKSQYAVFTIGSYTFRPSDKLLFDIETSKKIRLTEKETSLLRFLVLAGERGADSDTLLDEIWGYNSGLKTHTLETHIYRLRRKLELDISNPIIIMTERKGYRLVPSIGIKE
jgi:DNA-binding response OmpR family regulator